MSPAPPPHIYIVYTLLYTSIQFYDMSICFLIHVYIVIEPLRRSPASPAPPGLIASWPAGSSLTSTSAAARGDL